MNTPARCISHDEGKILRRYGSTPIGRSVHLNPHPKIKKKY
jgi:hypothetical protein